MKHFLILFVIFLMFLGRASQAQEIDQGATAKKNVVGACPSDRASLELWDGVYIIPVQFIEYKDDKLRAHFASRVMFQQIYFNLPPSMKQGFFASDKEWEGEAGRKGFLKKIKKDFWLVAYREQEGEKIICEVHQFKNWESLTVNYGQSTDNPRKSVDTIAYWQSVRVRPIYFYAVTDEQARWLFMNETEELKDENTEMVELGEGVVAPRIFLSEDDIRFKLIEHGAYSIAKNCVFHVLETKGPKKINLPTTEIGITLGKLKTRVKLVSRAYFVENSKKYFWLCFFDQDAQVLLRAVQVPDAPKEDTLSKKNDKEHDVKNGKNLK